MKKLVAAISVSGVIIALMWVLRFFEFAYRDYVVTAASVILLFAGGILLKVFSPRVRFRKFFRFKMPGGSDLLSALWLCLMLVSGSFLLNYVSSWAFSGMGVSVAPAMEGLEQGNLLLSALTAVLLPAFFEEFYFRGAVLSSLKDIKPLYALLLSSLIFMLMHGVSPYFLANFYAGIILGCILELTRSLPCAILAHFLHNVLSYILYFYSEKLSALDRDAFIVSILVLLWLFGLYKVLSAVVRRLRRKAAADATVINEGARVWAERNSNK